MKEILVRMARGGKMLLLAEGRVYKDSDGTGQHWIDCDDFTLYWPGRGSKGKLYQVRDELVVDIKEAEGDYIEAVTRPEY